MSGDMRDFYDHPDERAKWGERTVAQGLYPTEAHLVGVHFVAGSSVLDVGCGGGREAFALAEMGFAVTAIDNDAAFVERVKQGAAERGLSITTQPADATALPFADAQFDHVIMVGQLLGHIRPREKRIQALREIGRISQGAAIISTNAVERHALYRLYFALINAGRKIYNPRDLEPDDALVRRIGGKAQRGARPVFHWYRTPALMADARAAGWRVVEMQRRYEFEEGLDKDSESGETFYVLRKDEP